MGPERAEAPLSRGLRGDQALGRLPWLAALFLRARRLRPFLAMVVVPSTSVPPGYRVDWRGYAVRPLARWLPVTSTLLPLREKAR